MNTLVASKLSLALASALMVLTVTPAQANSTIVTDAIGTPELWEFEEVLGVQKLLSNTNQIDGKGITQTWDANGNKLSRTDAEGRTTTYSYNATNQRTSMTEAVSTAEALWFRRRFWKWFHKQPDMKDLKNPRTGQVSYDDAKPYCDDWIEHIAR